MSKGRSQSSNDARSRSMNPQDAAGRAAANDHANQGNPNNPAHPSGGTGTPPKSDGPSPGSK